MKKDTAHSQFFGVHIPNEIAETLKEHAEIFGRSISAEIRVLVRDGLLARKSQMEFARPKRKKP